MTDQISFPPLLDLSSGELRLERARLLSAITQPSDLTQRFGRTCFGGWWRGGCRPGRYGDRASARVREQRRWASLLERPSAFGDRRKGRPERSLCIESRRRRTPCFRSKRCFLLV